MTQLQDTTQPKSTSAPAKAPDKAPEKPPEKPKKSYKVAIPPAFTLKLLVACISVAFYVLLAIFIGLIFAGPKCDISVLEQSTALEVWGYVVLIGVMIFLSLSVLQVILAIFTSHEFSKKYRKFYDKAGIVVLFLIFASLGCLDTTIIINISPARFMAGLSMFFAGLLAFAPLFSAWQIREEDRLKNFIDAMSRVCTTLAFIGGICAFLFSTLFG